jgi:hypothetical protein
MTDRTLRDLLVEASDDIDASDLAAPAITQAKRRARQRRGVAGTVAVVAASVFAVSGGLDLGLLDTSPPQDDAPAPATQPTTPTPPSNPIVSGWEIVGEPQWIPLRNKYHAATVYAVNRTSHNLSPRRGPVLWAAYENPDAPGQFEASCLVIEVSGEPPENRQDLFAAPRRERAVAPGETVFFSCVQIEGTAPHLGPGELRIDVESARFTRGSAPSSLGR